MRLPIFSALVMLSAGVIAQADSPTEPTPLIFTPVYPSDVSFAMVPRRYGPGPDYKVIREAYGIAYRLTEEGELKEMYRTEGWYSFEVFMSIDGKYLVQMGPWNDGWDVNSTDLAIAFRKDGKLVKSYSTADLIKDPEKVERSITHYRWRAPSPHSTLTDKQKEALMPRLSYENEFTLNTIDGWTYVFDATTGKIKSTKRTKGETGSVCNLLTKSINTCAANSLSASCTLTPFPPEPMARATKPASDSPPEKDKSVEKICPHCGSARLRLVDIYHKPQQIPAFLLPKPEPDDTT